MFHPLVQEFGGVIKYARELVTYVRQQAAAGTLALRRAVLKSWRSVRFAFEGS